jgi:uncharacterized protein (TIGR02996 family)
MPQAGFLDAILEHPDDDTPRLAYADWLEERGDPRGEFIRVQCALARLAGPVDDWVAWAEVALRRRELERRQRQLLAEHGRAWAAPVEGLVSGYEFRRGFVEGITAGYREFAGRAAQLFRLAPIRRVRLVLPMSEVSSLAACPYLARLRALDLTGNRFGDHGLSLLLASPHLQGLTALVLRDTGLTGAGALALAKSPALARLESLDLARNHVPPGAVRALLQSDHFRLRALDLAGTPADTSRGLGALASAWPVPLSPADLRAVLRLLALSVPAYSGKHLRVLVEQARANPGDVMAVLRRGLGNPRRGVRRAAARLLGRLQPAAVTASVPQLVRRLHEPDAGVRYAVGAALAEVLPSLPEVLQQALCVLANPVRPPEEGLNTALGGARFSEPVWREFSAVCRRRVAWRDAIAGRPAPPAPSADWDAGAVRRQVEAVLGRAEESAVRHATTGQDLAAIRRAACDKECAWLLARLCELVQRAVSPAAS